MFSLYCLNVRLRQRSVRDDHASIPRDCCLTAATARGDLPQRIDRRDVDDGSAEGKVPAKIVSIGVVAEIIGKFHVARVVGHRIRHRELGECGGALRRDEVRRLVDGAVRVVDVPEPTDVVVALEAVERYPGPIEVSRAGQSRRARSDQRVLLLCDHPSSVADSPNLAEICRIMTL